MSFNLADTVLLLDLTPRAIDALLTGLPPEITDATEGPESWSPKVIVAHLLHAERTNWLPRALTIRTHGTSIAMPAFDQAGQAHGLADQSLAELLKALVLDRADNIATLRSWKLNEDDLAFVGVHPEFGRVTLTQLLASWATHDLAHLAQISRVLAKQHRDAVGPWRVYLPILDR